MTSARQWIIYGLIDPRSPRAIRYIGLTKDIRSREKVHRSEKRDNNSGLMEWKQDLRAAGVELLAIPLEIHRNLQSAQEAERYFIRDLCARRMSSLLNICDGGAWGGNHSPSDQTRARLREAQLGRKMSPEAIAKAVAWRTGRKRSPETRAKISAANRGRKLSADGIEKIRQANTGRVRGLELRARISTALRGRPKSLEHRAKISAALKTRWRTKCAKTAREP